jgi:hypothetical protein
MSGPLLDAASIRSAREAADSVIAGHYEAGRQPLYRNWNRGDEPCSLVKIDLPHLCDRVIQRTAADGRIGEWAAVVLGVRLIQMWACELICKYPTPPGGPGAGAIGWHQDDQSFPHWQARSAPCGWR